MEISNRGSGNISVDISEPPSTSSASGHSTKSKADDFKSAFALITYIGSSYLTCLYFATSENGQIEGLIRDNANEKTFGIFGLFDIGLETKLFIDHILLSMVTICLAKAWKIDAGKVPESWSPYHSKSEQYKMLVPLIRGGAPTSSTTLEYVIAGEKNKSGKYRWCTHCNRWKPDRTHHCRKCNRCVLKMDHHCPWTNSCIGFYNYRYYLLLLFYGTVSTTWLVIAHWRIVYSIYYVEDKTWTDWWIIFDWAWSAFMAVNCAMLGLFHMSLVIKNLTTLEWKEKKGTVSNFRNVYDLNPVDNFTQVFGLNAFIWLIPTRYGVLGDGLSFPTNKEAVLDNETEQQKNENDKEIDQHQSLNSDKASIV